MNEPNQLTANSIVVEISKLNKELNHWESFEPINNMGKYARQTKIDSITERITELRAKITVHKTLRLIDILPINIQ